jgi:DNA primase catalytic subunit
VTRKIIYLALPFALLFFASTANAQNANTQNTNTRNANTARNTEQIDAATKLRQQMELIQQQKKTATSPGTANGILTATQIQKQEFREKLAEIKDAKKKTLTEKIDAKIEEINKKQTAKFLENLTNIQMFLDKIKQQQTTGSKLSENIAIAQLTIDFAKSQVNAQAEKIYVITIKDETTLKQNVGKIVAQFRSEMAEVHKLVMEAKWTVQKLNTERNTVTKEATGSAGF